VSKLALDLAALVKRQRWSPRSTFPPSRPLSDVVFTLGDGLFLITNPLEPGELVVAVGWAQSDYWAGRAFDNPFRGDLTSPAPKWGPPPSLTFLGRPGSLSFATIRSYERERTGRDNVILVTGDYRHSDGAFLHCSVNGSDGITYMYASNRPKALDEPVAIEFRLPEGR